MCGENWKWYSFYMNVCVWFCNLHSIYNEWIYSLAGMEQVNILCLPFSTWFRRHFHILIKCVKRNITLTVCMVYYRYTDSRRSFVLFGILKSIRNELKWFWAVMWKHILPAIHTYTPSHTHTAFIEQMAIAIIIIIVPHHKLLRKIIENYTIPQCAYIFGKC